MSFFFWIKILPKKKRSSANTNSTKIFSEQTHTYIWYMIEKLYKERVDVYIDEDDDDDDFH